MEKHKSDKKELTDKNRLIRKFHTLITINGISEDEKQMILHSYGVDSSIQLNEHDLEEICNDLRGKTFRRDVDYTLDKPRKRVIKAIGAYLDSANAHRGKKTDITIDMIKAIACRAAGAIRFNAISACKLAMIYNTFCNERKSVEEVNEMTEKLLRETGIKL